MRRALRFLVLVVAAYGPLAPAILVFLFAVPPLVFLSGWSWWVKLLLLSNDLGLVLGAALWLGPGMLAEIQQTLELERRS
jgi:hypothetical protein